MPSYEVFMPQTLNKNSFWKFGMSFKHGFDCKSENYESDDFESELEDFESELESISEAFSKSGDFKIFSFELSDMTDSKKIYAGFAEAFRSVNDKHRNNAYVRAFFDQTFEDEFYSFAGGSFCRFDTVDEIYEYKDMLAAKQMKAEEEKAKKRASRASSVSQKITEMRIIKYAIIRIRIEDKSHEPVVIKAFDEILSTGDLAEKDSIFSSMMDSITESGETYFTDYSGPWRKDLQYDKGKIGDLDFLGNILEYDLSRKSLKLLLSNAPHRRKKYLSLIWGLFGIFGEKVAIKIWSKLPNRTRILWHQEDNIMGPTKEGALEIDDWNFTNLKSLNCNYYDWDW